MDNANKLLYLCMENLKDTSTAELLAEWGRLNDRATPLFKSIEEYRDTATTLVVDWFTEQMQPIAAELDRRCSDLVENNNGKPKIHITDCTLHFDGDHLTAVTFRVSLEELRDMLTWLLLKGGNG